MTITIPVYSIHCDDCGNVSVFPLAATQYDTIYEMLDTERAYALFGGETLPDGKHRCALCHSKIAGAVEIDYHAPRRTTMLEWVYKVITAARSYRKAEQDGTPRLWRGKALQDKASELDDALAQHEQTHGEGNRDVMESSNHRK